MDTYAKQIRTGDFESQFGDSAGELKDALDSFRIMGFEEFNPKSDEADPLVRPIGSKPTIKNLVEGVFFKTSDDPDDESRLFHAPKHKAIRRLQSAADNAYIVDAMMRAGMSKGEEAAYDRSGGMTSLDTWKRFEARRDDFTKAVTELIDTSTEVANWLPTQYGANLYEQIKIGLPLLNFFQEIAMSAGTMILPLDMNDVEAMRVTETTTSGGTTDPHLDVNHVNPGALASGKITAVAEKLRARFWLSAEADEDTIVAMIPFLNRKGRRAMGEAIEDAIVNGQITGNIDTALTHFTKANPPAATDARDCWDGLRYLFQQYTGSPATRTDAGGATIKPTVVTLRDIRFAMGEYGVDPAQVAYILGVAGYLKLLDDTNVMTVDKFGPNATVRTGSLAQVDGCDILVSRRVPQNTDATGNIANGGAVSTRTLALAVHEMACLLFNRRRITVGSQRWLASDSEELCWFWRGDFQPVYNNVAVPFGGELYNLDAA